MSCLKVEQCTNIILRATVLNLKSSVNKATFEQIFEKNLMKLQLLLT